MPRTNSNVPTQVMQGIEVPVSNVDPESFFRLTRRLTIITKTFNYAGPGLTDNVPILQTGILSTLQIKATGSLTVALPTGTCATTTRWPYDVVRAVRFSANGQSNLINCSGAWLKAREIMARGDLNDRGVVRGVGGASPGTQVNQGTLSLNNENWGVGQNVSAIAAASYPVELEWQIPVAFDQVNLMGAIFAQTSSTDLNLAIDWFNTADLFTLTLTATATLTLAVVVQATLFSIPLSPNGGVIVPDLSTFHSLIQTRFPNPANGLNEIRLSGQGVGRSLLRVGFRTFNGAVPAVLPINSTNYAQIGWRFGGNDTPEVWPDGKTFSYMQEKTFGSDMSSLAGIGIIDFASEWAFRDAIDEGTATELRILLEYPSALVLSTPVVEYIQETVSAGSAV